MRKFTGDKVTIQLIEETPANEKFCAIVHLLMEHCMDNPVRQLNLLSLMASGQPLNEIIQGNDMNDDLFLRMFAEISGKMREAFSIKALQLSDTTVEQFLERGNTDESL